MGTEKYGSKLWCVKVTETVSPDGEICAMADDVEVTESETLLLKRKNGDINLAIAKGQWVAFFAASMVDGSAVAVEHWEGEVINRDSENRPTRYEHV